MAEELSPDEKKAQDAVKQAAVEAQKAKEAGDTAAAAAAVNNQNPPEGKIGATKAVPEGQNTNTQGSSGKAPAPNPTPAPGISNPQGSTAGIAPGTATVGTIAQMPFNGSVVQETPEQAAAKAQSTVTMNFPHPVILTVTHARQIRFAAGLNEVPEDLVDHPYLKANGVVPYQVNKPSK